MMKLFAFLLLLPALALGETKVHKAQVSATGTPSATTFLRGDGTWDAPAFSGVTGTAAVGQIGTGTPSAAKYLRGDGAWTAPAFTEITGTATLSQIGATGSPSASTYLRGDGTWSSPSGSVATYRAAADVSTTATAATAVTGLSWSLPSSAVQSFRCTLATTGTATSAPKLSFTGFAVIQATVKWRVHPVSATAEVITNDTGLGVETAICVSGCLAARSVAQVEGVIVNSGTAQTMTLNVGSSTAGQTVTVHNGSTCEVR
jgi:hypothetical protein